MPRIPTVQDYGGRPSLRSNRVDLPGTGDLATGKALSDAASTVASIYGQQQEKKDRLNYSLAKNELLNADIASREAVKDDDDWATKDDRYTDSYNKARDEIYSRYGLDPDDMAMLDSDSELIRERGRVQVGDKARIDELDFKKAQIERGLEDALKNIQNLDNVSANELMFTQLENINAAIADGLYGDVEGLARLQEFVTDASTAFLMSMDVQDRIAELELTLAHRTARGTISRDDILKGLGSESIGDFLNKDVVVEMLRVAKDENKTSEMAAEVFDIVDDMVNEHQLNNAASQAARKRDGRNRLDKNDPEYGAKRVFFERAMDQRNAELEAMDNLALDEIDRHMMNLIQDGVGIDQLPQGTFALLPPQRQKWLQDYAAQWADDEGFAKSTNPDLEYVWYHLTPSQMEKMNINGTEWRSQLTRDDWNLYLRQQDASRNKASSNKPPNIYRGDPDDEVLKGMLVGGENALFKRVPKVTDTENYRRWVRIDNKVNKALTTESMRRWQKDGDGYLSPEDVQTITAQTIGLHVFKDRTFWADPEVHLVGLTEAEIESGSYYVEIAKWRNDEGPDHSDKTPQTMEQFFRNVAGVRSDDLSDRDLEKAYVLFVSGDMAGMMEVLTVEPVESIRLPL